MTAPSNVDMVKVETKPAQLTVIFNVSKKEIIEIRDASPDDKHSRTIALQHGIAGGSKDALIDYLYDHFFEIDVVYVKEGNKLKPASPSDPKKKAHA